MSTIADLRTGLSAVLDNISGLHVYKRWPDSIVPPAVLVKRKSGPRRTTFASNAVAVFELTVAVQMATAERAQDALDEYTAMSGTKSIVAALEADETLDGKAEYILIGEWGEDHSFKHPAEGPDYGGATLPLEVHFRW